MRRRTRTAKWLRALEALLLLAGLAGVGIWLWSYARRSISESSANRTIDHQIAAHVAAPAPSTQLASTPLENGALIGRLRIPRLHLQGILREGAGEDTLDVAVGHIPGTALPGQPGNVGLAGHRDTLFRGLSKIEKNDIIQVETGSAKYRYAVESTSIVKPEDVGVLAPGPLSEMTLVTCYPFNYVGSAPDRFIVKARLMGEPPAKPAAPATPVLIGESTQPPPRQKPRPVQPTAATVRRVAFSVASNHSREVAPGVLMGLTGTDPARRRANGWLWVSDLRRTVYLHDQATQRPFFFRGNREGKERELIITSVTRNSISGYLTYLP